MHVCVFDANTDLEVQFGAKFPFKVLPAFCKLFFPNDIALA